MLWSIEEELDSQNSNFRPPCSHVALLLWITVCGADVVDIQLIRKVNKRNCFYHNIHFVIFSSSLSSSCYLLKSDKPWKQREENFFCIDGCLSMSYYIKRNKKRQTLHFLKSIGRVIVTHRHTCINKPCWQSGEIIIWIYLWSR